MIRRALVHLAANLAALLVQVFTSTLRLETLHGVRLEALRAKGLRPIYAFWHGRQLPLFAWGQEPSLAILASLSRDGELQAAILRRLGFLVERGSGGRGGARGLIALVRRVRAGAAAAFAVDGGRGPVHTVHAGVLLLAARTGQPVVPLGVSVRRRHVFARSWDRYLLPAPFSPGAVVVGEPLFVERDAPREILAQELSRRLHLATSEADAACAAPSEPAATGRAPCPVCAAAASVAHSQVPV